MRTALVVSILVTASVASAEPLAVHAQASTEPAASTYVATGITFGGADGHTAAGVSLDLGQRVSEHVWLHAGGTAAADGELLGGQGRYLAAHGGLELASCHRGERVCAFAGADVGFAQSQYSTWSFDGTMSGTTDGVIGVLRVGLDIGGTHVRWRPGFEADVGNASAGALTQSIVFRF